jgi:hypothetical protein
MWGGAQDYFYILISVRSCLGVRNAENMDELVLYSVVCL